MFFHAADHEIQRADPLGFQPADFVIRFNVPPGLTRANGISQQHAVKAELPGVFMNVQWQVKGGSLRCVKTPSNTGAINPYLQFLQIILSQAEAIAKGGNLQKVQKIALGHAGGGQMKQFFKSPYHGKTGPVRFVGDGKWHKTGVLPRQIAENRFNMGGVNIYVGGHDDNVAWL